MERIQRVNQLLKKELSRIIFKQLDLPKDVLTTVTRVETAPNLIQVRVYISVLPEEQSKLVLQGLNRNIYGIQQQLNKRLNMRPIPKIIFIKEEQTIEAGRVEELLDKIQKND
ncbi:MAG: 30S ribosome-binding factor RbfA [Candidatus Nealsonbacteria bacterium]|nr:30S ribosome-binding factor RbfA [Candidatus Nealsonbacteria bacterium]